MEKENPRLYVKIDEHGARELRKGRGVYAPHRLLNCGFSLWPNHFLMHRLHDVPIMLFYDQEMVIGSLQGFKEPNESGTLVSYVLSDEEMEKSYALDRKTLAAIPELELWDISHYMVAYPNKHVLSYLQSATKLRTLIGDEPKGLVLPLGTDLKKDVPRDLSNWDIAIPNGKIQPERVRYE